MWSACVCLSVLLSTSCVLCQVTLLESGSDTLKPSDTLRLSCKVTGFSITTSDYCWNWIRQAPGKGLEWLGEICASGNIYYADSHKSRSTITRDTAKNEFYLQMSGMKPEDSATYYGAREGNGYFDYWGSGTTVTVTAVSSQAPSLYPLISCGASQNPVPIGCLAKDFLPDPVTFSWTDKSNSSFSGGLRTYPSVLRSGGTYSASSGVEVPLNSWNNGDPFYCKVTHSVLGEPLVKKLVKTVKKLIPPIVTLHPPIREDIEKGNATIVCMCRSFYPDTIKVSWLKDGMKVTSGVHTEGPVANSAGDFDLTSSIDITAADWNRNSLYSCFVDHAASNYWNSKNISKSLLCGATSTGPATIEVSTVAPTFEEVFIGKSAKLTCIVTNMVNYETLNITWTDLTKKEVIKTVITDAVWNDNGTYSAMGIASACAEDWIEGHRFECKVLHDELASQKTAYLQKENGTPTSKPVVYVYPPTAEELALKEYVTIVALIKRYNPCDVLVKWLREKDEVPKVDYVNTKPIEEADPTTGQRTCLLYSTLRVTESDWNSGTVFTCVVGHESLPMQLTQKSIDKTVVKALYIDEEEDMEDIWRTTSTFIILFLLSLFYSATVTLFKVK